MSERVVPQFDELIHGRHRLQLCALLFGVESVDFPTLREALDVSESVLSKQVKHLADAGYVLVAKKPHGKRTRTWVSLTKQGQVAYSGHVAALQHIVDGG